MAPDFTPPAVPPPAANAARLSPAVPLPGLLATTAAVVLASAVALGISVDLSLTLLALAIWLPWIALRILLLPLSRRREVTGTEAAIALACFALLAGTGFAHWPLRLAFAASRPWLDAVADRVEAGNAPAGPVWAGAIRVAWSDRSYLGSVPSLWTRDTPTGDAGFVRCPGAHPGHRFNLWASLYLGDGWWFIEED